MTHTRRALTAMFVKLMVPCALLTGCVGSSAASPATAPVPTEPSVAAVTTAPDATTAPATTAPVTTVSETTTTSPADTTAPATTDGTEPAGPGGDPFLVDIPGKMIDYVPDVAAKAGIDVPGQYYEILDKFYVFIPAERSEKNLNMQTPLPEDKPVIEAYVRALASLWAAFTTDPVPAEGTPEMRAAYTDKGFQPNLPILEGLASSKFTTIIRGGNISVPWVQADRRSDSFGQVVDCGWQDQYDVNSDGEKRDDFDKPNPLSGDMVKVDQRWLADELVKADWACV